MHLRHYKPHFVYMIVNRHNRGFVALTSVLVLSAILFSISVTVTSRAISKVQVELSAYSEMQAKLLAHSCAEYALLELQRTLDYAGDETLTINDQTCDIVTVSGSGNADRGVQTKATVNEHVYRMEVAISEVSPVVRITSWRSVSQF